LLPPHQRHHHTLSALEVAMPGYLLDRTQHNGYALLAERSYQLLTRSGEKCSEHRIIASLSRH
jgi:hypothetical protein